MVYVTQRWGGAWEHS